MSVDNLTAAKEDIEVFSIENYVLLDSQDIFPEVALDKPFMISGIAVAICMRGSLTVRINYRDHRVDAGSVVLILPNNIVRVTEKTDDCFASGLFFGADFIAEFPSHRRGDLLLTLRDNPCVKAGEEDMESLLELHALITRHSRTENNQYKENMVRMLLYALVMEIGSLYAGSESENTRKPMTRQEEITNEFFMLLIEHHKKEHSVTFYAEKMFITPKYLSSVIKQVTGRPVLKWIDEAIVLQSKRLLKTTSMTVLQVSEEMNFPNPSFFSRFFKQYTGQTPLQFRNS